MCLRTASSSAQLDMASRGSYSRPSSLETTHSTKKPKRASSTCQRRTSLVLAYPAPVYADKTHILKHLRPRLYLQLQRLSDDGRHYQPAIDVLSLAPPKDPKRLMSHALRKCMSKFKSHGGCLHFDKRDILLTGVSDDDSDSDSSPERPGIERVLSRYEDLMDRKVIAVLRTNNKIVTQDGRTWMASRRSNGSFEFTSVDDRGETSVARWVSPRSARLSMGSRTLSSTRSGMEWSEAAFNFSLIDPSSRRHPVLATLSPSVLEIKDTYHLPTSMEFPAEKPSVRVVNSNTRMLITATAVYVALYLGWSPSY